jgi:hypothetical protein
MVVHHDDLALAAPVAQGNFRGVETPRQPLWPAAGGDDERERNHKIVLTTETLGSLEPISKSADDTEVVPPIPGNVLILVSSGGMGSVPPVLPSILR